MPHPWSSLIALVLISSCCLPVAPALARGNVLECIRESVFGDRMPGKWAKTRNHKEGFYLNADTPKIRIEDQKFFVRNPSLPVKDSNYILNAVESIEYFDQQLKSLDHVKGSTLEKLTQKMHRIAAYGNKGDRIYSGATGKIVEPGQFWTHDGLINGRPSISCDGMASKQRLKATWIISLINFRQEIFTKYLRPISGAESHCQAVRFFQGSDSFYQCNFTSANNRVS